ncbi:DUF262 domain-containing protein [Paracnuella aquatica]|uniref:DUF262 domain-containing protein n=1 Tax=Paracnuella aquatica TaxID=2268757 RepID=UPI000DEF5964|nr:DUF262 domain-containing protein [Paracnuella aquatica]RPD50641.1 DUF262 domain-containing protein [Paracnuella aquatica]
MAYQIPITIKEAINAIQKRKYVLPSIQREFVWGADQIETLFDSIMRDYPISTFLFWNVQKQKIKDFQFYEFLKDYHEKNQRHNKKADLPDEEDVIAVLDGQQRLTSIYIGLKGSYAEKLPYYKWDSPHAFPKKKLYLNLLSPSNDLEMEYDFQFLTDGEVNSKLGFWFPVGEILEFKDLNQSWMYLMKNGLIDASKYDQNQIEFASNALTTLFNVVHQKGTLSYYLEQGEELDKVLQIFIRINSGGTKLSYSDLLLSIATAQWAELDAREVIHGFVDEINTIGSGFSFNKDFVLKSCLVLGDFNDIKFKVDNFSRENMLKIESSWPAISGAIRNAIKLIARFGFNRDNLTTSNAVIPIAYYLYKNNHDETYLSSSHAAEDRRRVKEWLLRVILKKTFGGTPDNIYPVLRRLVNENIGAFPLERIIDQYRGHVKSIIFTVDDIDNLLNVQYGSAFAFAALSLLYDGLNMTFQYHQDHIHPKSFFTNKKLRMEGIEEEQYDIYYRHFNTLANLQLIEAVENVEKSATPIKDWLNKNCSNVTVLANYKAQHFIPLDLSLDLKGFPEFIEKRKQLIRERFQAILNIENVSAPEFV